MELKLIGQIVRRWSWLLVIGLLIGGGMGYALSVYQTPEYLARTKLLVLEPLSNNVNKVSGLNDKELADTYIELLKTQPILDSAGQKVGKAIKSTNIKVDRVRGTSMLELSVRDTDPQAAALMANVLVETLIDYNEALQVSRFSSSEQSLELQVKQIEDELSKLETNIEQRSDRSVEEQRRSAEEQKVELEGQIFALQGEIARLEQDIDDLTPKSLPNELPPPLTLEQRSLLNEKRTQLSQKQFLLDLYQKTYFKLALETDPTAVDAASGAENIEQANLTLYRQLYSTLQSNYEAVRLARMQNTPNVVQVERATPPVNPIQSGPINYIVLGAILGLLVTGTIAFVLEYMDDTLKTPQDINNVLGLPVVGTVVNESGVVKHEGTPYVSAHPRSPMAETFRTLRTNLEFASVDKPLKTILITSPGISQGKTTIAANLAAVMAQANKRVILLEGDLRRPRVHSALGMSNQVGLSDVFRGQMDIRDVARYSKVKDLAVITSGALPPNPAELLGSVRMTQILARLVESASVVIIDSPPFVVTDSTVLASKVDGVLLVIQPGKTHAEAARTMLAQLNRAGAHVVGVVLNRVSRKDGSYYGYYRYEDDAPMVKDAKSAEPVAGNTRRGLASLFNGNDDSVKSDIGKEIA